MFVPNCKRCPLPLNLTSFVFNVSKSYTLCPLALTQSDFFVKYGHTRVCYSFYPFILSLNKTKPNLKKYVIIYNKKPSYIFICLSSLSL
ncbi:hypothetical protein HanIR_Chr16g0795231 [Helianthus annuus]|nr:hypothetical protein HanIR_Chr16g0795231 [Helianthus annuus]